MVQMQELQKQFGNIKESLIETYGLKFVQKHSQLNGFKYFFVALCYFGGAFVLGYEIGILINIATLPARCLCCILPGIGFALVSIPLSVVTMVYSFRYLRTYIHVRPAYKNWLQFIV